MLQDVILIANLAQALRDQRATVTLAGWVHTRRDHGGLIFLDLRDASGLVQLVFQPQNQAMFQQAEQLRSEWVIEVRGSLQARQTDLINPKITTGHLEVVVAKLRILNEAQTPPIPISDYEAEASEDKRLLYRYLDLRRPQMQANLKLRGRFYQFLRGFMEAEGFWEIPTPILANSSPEGARDFLIPARLHPGKFYALPQAPQQFKQLLMVGGVARYYQIAPCFRDEDPRADRYYGDFYQLDLEMAFVEDGAVVRQTVEPLIKGLILDFGQLKLHHNQIVTLTYQEAMENYGTDKPDLRFDLKLHNVGFIFAQTGVALLSEVLKQQGLIKALKVPGLLNKKQVERLTDLAKERGARGLAVLSYHQASWQGPLVKFLTATELEALAQTLTVKDGETILLVADQTLQVVNKVLGVVRSLAADYLRLKDKRLVSVVWIIDFPFYEQDEQTQALTFAHNPFSKPKGDLKQAHKLAIVADQFDLVMNGYEVCSGAVRNHNPKILLQAFTNLGYDLATVKMQFKALLTAFRYGAPPHAGCAFGLDRILMILAQTDNIRELVAFPKNGSGVDLMMDSPTSISDKQKRDLGLRP